MTTKRSALITAKALLATLIMLAAPYANSAGKRTGGGGGGYYSDDVVTPEEKEEDRRRTTAKKKEQAEAMSKDQAALSATVAQCYASLTKEAPVSDMLQAVACMKRNPYAGSSEAQEFVAATQSFTAATSPDVASAIRDLTDKKESVLYWNVYFKRNGEQILVAGDTYVFDQPTGKVKDLSALDDLRVVVKSRLLGEDETIPFSRLKEFMYLKNPQISGDIGTLGVVDTANSRLLDTTYKGHYPIKQYKEKPLAPLMRVVGTAYKSTSPMTTRQSGYSLNLAQSALDGIKVTLLDPAEGARLVQSFQAKINAETEQRAADSAQKAEAKDQAASKLKAAARGDEDSCTVSAHFNLASTTGGETMERQMMNGKVDLTMLKETGWIVTGASKVGNATLVTIRKAR